MKRKMNRKLIGLLALVMGAAACSNEMGAPDMVPAADQTEILTALDESGFFEEDFGIGDVAQDFQVSGISGGLSFALTGSASAAAQMDTVEAARLWGRRRGRPVRRVRAIERLAEDTVAVMIDVAFDGEFKLDITKDGQLNPTSKPLQEVLMQRAVLARRSERDSSGRRWQLVGLSPQQFVMTDAEKRTVALTNVIVKVNGEIVLEVTNPDELLRVNDRIPLLHRGDSVEVIAQVENTTGTGNIPPTFVYLHLLHADPTSRIWRRVLMQERDGQFVKSWIVRHTGRNRIAVDAIDSQTFNTQTDDDYRANIWAIPYRIE